MNAVVDAQLTSSLWVPVLPRRSAAAMATTASFRGSRPSSVLKTSHQTSLSKDNEARASM